MAEEYKTMAQGAPATGVAQTGVGAVAEEYRGKAEEVWSDAKDRARTLQEKSEDYVRQHPLKAVLTALGIGFVLALIFRH